MRNKKLFERISYCLLYAAIILCGLYFVRNCRYWMIDDSLSYLSLARLYSQGQFWKAVNSHWSPAFSWVLAIIKLSGIDELYWGKMILVAGIIPSVVVIKQLGKELQVHDVLIFLLSVAVSIILFHSALANFTPDILIIPALLYILLQFTRALKNKTVINPLALGVVAALGFYIKQYALFYFILFSILFFIIILFSSNQRKKISQSLLKAIAVFFIIIAPWVILISIKSQHFTFSSASAYNINLLSVPDKTLNGYMSDGLISLPYPEAYSYWDVPSTLPINKVSMFDAYGSKTNFIYQVKRMYHNYKIIFGFTDFMLKDHLALIFLLSIILIIFHYIRRDFNAKYYLVAFSSILIYSAGYIFLVSDYRYTYFDIVMFLLLASMVINDVLKTYHSPYWVYFILGALAFYELSRRPIQKTTDFYTAGISRTQQVKRVSAQLAKGVNTCNYETEDQQSHLVYENDFKDYGMLKAEQPLSFKLNELDKYDIRYIISLTAIDDSINDYINPVIENDEGIWIYETKKE